MKISRNILSVASLVMFLLTAFTTQMVMAQVSGGSTTPAWSPGKPLITLSEGGNVILRPGKCGFRLANNARFGIEVGGEKRSAFTMKGTSCEIAGDSPRLLDGIDMGYFPAGTQLHFYHEINGWGGTVKSVFKASSKNLGTSSETFADVEVFMDRNRSLGFGGSVVERVADLSGATTPIRRWVLHLDDAAGGDDDDDDVPIEVLLKTGKPTWRMRTTGNIVHGPGSYYTTEKDVTLEFREIKTEAAALRKVQELASKNPSNPPVMWQLSNFPGKRDGHLIVHLKKFMSKPLDRETGYSVDCYTAFHAEYGKKNVHPVRVGGFSPPLYYLSNPSETKSSCMNPGWQTRTTGNIVHGPGSYYTREKDVTLEFKEIKTEAAAWRKIAELESKNPTNLPVMWQLSNFPGKPDGHLIVHLKKFMSKPLDRETGYSVDCYTAFHAEYGKKNVHPVRVGGSSPPLHYLSDPTETMRSCMAGGLTVGSFSSATSTSASTGKVKLYQHYNYDGIEKGYGVGDHVWIGDTYSGYLGLSSFKIPKGLSVTFYEGKGLTGKSYGPFDGALSYNCLGCAKHPMIPNDKIFSLKVTDISTKAKREAEAEKRAKLEADKKAAVAKAKAAAELAKKKEECKADVVFLMDNTGSMGSVIDATKASAANILNKIAGADPRFKGLNVKFGVATYWGDPKEHKCETKATDVKLYQHWHYGGKEKGYKVGKHAWIGDTYSGYLGLSSFKIPKGLSVYLWQGRDFKKTMYGPYKGPLDIECLANRKGDGCPHSDIPNDHIHSIEVVKTSDLPPKTKAGCATYREKQCYWMENTSGKYCWVPRSSDGFARCKALDSCDGGGGLSGGGCYKFAECSDCKRMPWSGTGGSFSSATSTSSSTKTASADTGDGYQECARKAYKVNQPLTKSKASAASAMKQWKACSAPGGCGGDWPEANFFALQQLATEGEMTDGKGTSDKGFASGYKVGWREDAGRVVVWFGDAPSHTTTVDREEASKALLDKKILVTAINTQGKGAGMDSASLTYGTSGKLPHYCSVKTCLFGKGKCDAYACETGGSCKALGYDCSLISKPKPTGQATHIASVTRGTVHHEITGGDKVVKTILEAAAAGIADAGVGSAVTFNGSFLARDSQVFFGKMDPKAWSGDVQAWPLNEKTAAIDVAKGKTWSAAETMDAGSPTSRVMLTYQRAVTDSKGVTTPGKGIALRWDELSDEQKADMQSNHKGEIGDEKEGETRLSFLRGDRADEGKGYGFRIRDSRLGDIWHSSPVHVGAPRPPRWAPRIKSKAAVDMFKAYLSFVRTSGDREPIVYVGANDGALHGFNARTGKEVLSYFPAALYASLKDSKGGGYHKLANPEYSHTDYVDATPSVFDAYLRDDGGSKQWRSVLIGSLGGGGRGFFGLDVTDPSAFSEANVDDIVMGEFSNTDDAHLGYSYSKPRFGKMNNGRSAVIIGNGLDDTATDETGGQAQLFIVYLDGDTPGDDGKWDLGKDYIRIATGKGSAEVGLRNGLFTPSIVDVNGDGTIDRAYAGDLQGNLWAFDLSSKSSLAWKVAMDKTPLLKAEGDQPITAAPLVVRPNHRAMGRTRRDMPGLMVMFGTGRFLKDRDKVYTDPQRFYAIYDRGVPIKKVKSQLVQQPLRQKTIETATGESRKIRLTKGKLKVPYSHSEFPKYGWYMNLPEKGERVVSEAKFARGVVYFNSIVPDLSVCSSGGEGWEMAVKLVNGGNPKAGNHDVNEDEKVDGDDAADKDGDEAPAGKRLEGRGMPTGPKLFGDRRFTATSKMEDGSDLKTTALERIDRERQGRMSWEELQPRQQ